MNAATAASPRVTEVAVTPTIEMSMTVLASKNNSSAIEKYIIPKNAEIGNTDFVEITIDYTADIFIAKRMKVDLNLSAEWQEYNDFTFPSSLLNKFLHHTNTKS